MRRVAKQVIRSQSERKYIATSLDTAISFNASLLTVAMPTLGTGNSNRIGQTITPTVIQLKGVFSYSDPYNLIRMMVVQWHPDNQVDVPLAQDFFNAVGNLHAPDSNTPDPSIRNRYTVLSDRRYVVSSAGPVAREFNFSVYPKKKILFNTGLTTGKNHIYVVAVSDSGVAPHAGWRLNLRMSYQDI